MDFKVGQDSDHQDIVAKQVVEVVAKGWLPYSELKDALNCTASTAKRVVQRCAEKGLLDKDGQGYKLAEKASQLLSLTGANLKRKDKATPIWKRGNDD
jgi:DNA-binding IclR family transcriptional regulator